MDREPYSRLKSLMNVLLVVPLGYLVICAVLYFRQDRMIFVPDSGTEAEQDPLADAEGFEPWINAKGERIGWKSRDGDEANVLLVLSGNGGCAINRTYYRGYCRGNPGNWKTFLLEYPGYGIRPGTPSEPALTAAAVDALDLLSDVPGREIRVLGVSLGSGVACAVAARRPQAISGLILETPFNSLVAAAQGRYPWLPVAVLSRTRFASDENLRHFPGPVAFIVGERDTTVPAALGRKLYEGYPGRKKLWSAPDADHDVSDFLQAEWNQILAWLEGGTVSR